MRDYATDFPKTIDDRVFFSDINIDKLSQMTKFQTYINNGAYSAASKYINNSTVDFYGAWILNLIEERMYALENYAVDEMEKPDIITDQEEEPTDVETNYCWTY